MEDGGIHTNYKCPILNRGEEERKLDLNGGVCLGGGEWGGGDAAVQKSLISVCGVGRVRWATGPSGLTRLEAGERRGQAVTGNEITGAGKQTSVRLERKRSTAEE